MANLYRARLSMRRAHPTDRLLSFARRARSTATPCPSAFLSLASGLVALMLFGCGSTGSSTPEVTKDGLVKVSGTGRAHLWIKPDHHIGRYDDILINAVGYQYGRGQDRLDSDQEAEITAMLEGALMGVAESEHVDIVEAKGPCVVAVNLGLMDLRLHTSSGATSQTSYVSSFGSATMIVEFRDSESEEALLRYVANRGLGGGPGDGTSGADLKRLGRALGSMVTDMTTELQRIVPDTTAKTEHECNDGIYKLTGRG